MPSQSAAAAPAAWARLLAVLISRAYRASVLVLCAVAIAPLLFGWASFVIKSGSMEPSINVGDVVVARPFETGETIAVGRVYVFNDPAASEEHTLTHRIVEKLDDGTYVSAGDANEVTDFTPVTASDMEARGIILAPYVGLPRVWLQAGEWVKLALWLLLTIAAFALATRNLDGEPPKSNLARLVLERRRDRTPAESADGGEAPDPAPAPGGPGKVPAARRGIAPAVVGVVLAFLGTGLGTANAAFVGQTRNSNWSFTVGPWAQPYVSAVLADSPQVFWLLDEKSGTAAAQDRSGNQFLGSYKPAAVLGQAGGLPKNAGTSMSTTGGLAFTSSNAAGSQTTHTMEFWFKSADQSGGYLTGFGSSTTTGTPSDEDRIVRLTSAGRITYGDWDTNQKTVLTTPLAYDDNVWHHVVVASTAANGGRQSSVIYVDGVARVSGLSSRVANYTGYVRIGGGTGTAAFNGSVDNVSVYGTALSASRVAAHWAAR